MTTSQRFRKTYPYLLGIRPPCRIVPCNCTYMYVRACASAAAESRTRMRTAYLERNFIIKDYGHYQGESGSVVDRLTTSGIE